MSDAFKDEMSKIAMQAEARRLLEIRAEERRKGAAKVRNAILFLIVTAILVVAYYYRADMQKFVEAKLDRTPTVNAATSAALQGLKSNADKRDKALDELTK